METKKLFGMASVVLALAACGQPQGNQLNQSAGEQSTGIVGGTDVQDGDAIAQTTVGLVMEFAEGGQGICTGTLVAENLVVTAAHCLEGLRRGHVVFARDVTTAQNSVSRRIEKAMVNPAYEPKEPGRGGWNDIGVLRFEGKALPAGYKIAPMLLDEVKLVKALPVIFAGYGITSPEGQHAMEDDSGVLRKVDTELADSKYEGNELLFERRENKASTCQGDSGGPAYATIDNQITLIGVTSRGLDEKCDGVSISTSLPAQKVFVQKAMAALKTATTAGRKPAAVAAR